MVDAFKARTDLPASMLRDIGRLIVLYAHAEQYLQGIIYMLVGVDAGIGRLAVREPGRLTDRLDFLLDLMAAKKLQPPDVDYKLLRKAIEGAMDMRNLCAHSTWIWSPEHKAYAVLVTRGQWADVPKSEMARRSKRLFPEGALVRASSLKVYLAGMQEIADDFRHIQASLEAQLRSSPEKRP